jgi:beta-galactosidase
VADVDSNQYPGVDWTVWKANDHKAKRPFYISEYAHNMCNAMGNLKDYQDAIESSDVILGAAIWDWVDQGLWKKNKDGKMILAYGGDFGDKPNDGLFVMNGTINSDRSLQPGYHEVKHVFQPFDIKFSEDGSHVTVRNLNYFRSGEGYSLKSSEFSADLSMPPRGEQTFALPPNNNAKGEPRIGRAVGVELKEDEGILKKGHLVACEEWTDKRLFANRETISSKGTVTDLSDEKTVALGGTNFTVRFCRKTGALCSYVRNSHEHLAAPMTVDAFRAPVPNDGGLGRRWMEAGLNDLVQTATSISPVETNADGSKSVTIVADVRGKNAKPHSPRFIVAQKWTVFGDGLVACQSEIRPRGRVMELARIGYRFTLDMDSYTAMWLGAGPHENYPDRKSSAHTSLWTQCDWQMVERYAKPQDMGNRENTYMVLVAPNAAEKPRKSAFIVMTLGEPFSFSAIPYSPMELMQAAHPEELPEMSKVELGIFAAVRGLGGASCGPGPLGRDIVRNDRSYKLDFVIGKFVGMKDKLPAMQPAELPPDVRTGEDIVPTVVACSSAEPGEGDAEHLVDGDLSTIWHSQYGVTLTKYPHSVTVDMGRDLTAKGVSVWQRQNGPNGNVKDFKFEVSEDGKAWREVVASQMKQGANEQAFSFAAPEKLRYWRFTGLNEHNGREFASLAEIRLTE